MIQEIELCLPKIFYKLSLIYRAACYNGDFEIVKLLVQSNADIESLNSSEETCLMCGMFKFSCFISIY